MTPAHWLGLVFLMWCALTILWSKAPYDSIGAMIQLSALAAAFCIGAEARDLKSFWLALALGASVNAVIGLLQLDGWHIFQESPGWTGFVGTFGNKNFLARFGVLALIGSLTLPWRWRSAWLVAGSALAAFLPMSRGALLAFAVAGLAAAIKLSRWRARAWLPVLAGFACIALVAIYGDLRLHPDRWATSLDPRLVIWDWTVSNWKVFGWGVGTYGSIFPFEHAFNDPFESIFELGIGAGILGAFLGVVLARPLCVEWVVLIAFLIEGFTAFAAHQAATVFVAAVCAGRLASMRHRSVLAESLGRIYDQESIRGQRAQPARTGEQDRAGGEAVPVRP